MNAFLAFLGMAAYGKHQQAEAARSRRAQRVEQALDALRSHAQQLHDAAQEMDLDNLLDPGHHSPAQLRAARRSAARAREALLLAEATQQP